MKITTGNYIKEDGSSREVKLLVLEKTQDSLKGIDITKLTDEEKEKLKKATDEYEKVISEVIKKSFRHFKVSGFLSIKEEVI
jgi:hypothetical protein